jgi:hypothetical protein
MSRGGWRRGFLSCDMVLKGLTKRTSLLEEILGNLQEGTEDCQILCLIFIGRYLILNLLHDLQQNATN